MNIDQIAERADRLKWLGLIGSQIRFDTTNRTFGPYTLETEPFEIPTDKEMGAVVLQTIDHQQGSDIPVWFGNCSAYDPTPLVNRDDCFLVLMALANANTMSADARATLASFGLYNDGSVAGRTFAVGDKLIFVGQNGLPPGAAYEARISSSQNLRCVVELLASYINNPRFISTV